MQPNPVQPPSVDVPCLTLTLGGSKPEGIEAYNTDGGWLNLSKPQLVDNCRRFVEEEGFRGVKIKVGLPDPREDVERVAAVRRTIGPGAQLMVDANGRCDLPTALELGRHFEEFGLAWFEEPLWFDDVEGPKRLAQSIQTRLGGISEWVAGGRPRARTHRLPVAPHIGDMMQVHLQLALAHPACVVLEYIPWALECFQEPATAAGGRFAPPELRADAISLFGVRLPS